MLMPNAVPTFEIIRIDDKKSIEGDTFAKDNEDKSLYKVLRVF